MADTASNASSTDDYIRELLDPDDRAKNVWHLIEAPKPELNQDTNGEDTTNQSQGTIKDQPNSVEQDTQNSNDNEHVNQDSGDKEFNHQREEENVVHGERASSRRDRSDRSKDDYKRKDRSEESRSRHHKDLYQEDERYQYRRDSRDSSSKNHRRIEKSPTPTKRESISKSKHRSRSRSRSSSLVRYRSRSRSNSESRYDNSSRSRRRRSARKRSRRHRSRSRSPRRSRHDRDRSRSESPLTKRNSRTIFLTQLNQQTTSRDLGHFFASYGRVREVRLIMDSKTRKHKGIAYIEFDSASSARRALNSSGKKLNGDPIVVQSCESDKNHHSHSSNNDYPSMLPQSRSAPLPPDSMRVYVGAINLNVTDDMLRSLFEPFGNIIRLELMKDHNTGLSRGYAFITYANADEALEAIEGLNGLELGGKPLKVSKSNERGERRAVSSNHNNN